MNSRAVAADPPEEKAATEEASPASEGKEAENKKPKQTDKSNWKPLRGKWEICRFGGEGPVEFNKDKITLGMGDPLTGIRWTGDFPRDSYELRCEGRRIDGYDFFCGVTFPVGEGKCSLILGGWGGGVLGLSSIDGEDASSNPTTQFKVFDNDEWYKIRVRVDPKQITCWVDDEVWVEQERENYLFDIRIEMDPCLPLGLANFQCVSEFKDIQWRPLKKQDSTGDAGAEKKDSSPENKSGERSETDSTTQDQQD